MKQLSEKQLLKISVAASVIGLILLFFYTEEIGLTPQGKFDEMKVEEEVFVQGRVGKVTQHENIAFLDVENQKIEMTKVILFKNYDVWLKEGDFVEVTGTVEEYEN